LRSRRFALAASLFIHLTLFLTSIIFHVKFFFNLKYKIMKPKMGRPPTPVEKAKTVLLGAKYDPREAKAITEAIAQSGLDKSKWLREAAIDAAHFWVNGEGWTIEDLHGKTVEFELVLPSGEALRGTGKFDVWQNGEGLLKIRIVTFDRKSTEYTKHELRIYIPQEGVRLIKRQPSGSTCDFSVFEPRFQKYVRGLA
jgi:hypothetical protein